MTSRPRTVPIEWEGPARKDASTSSLPLRGAQMETSAETVLQEVAEQFGEPARSTILYENWFKHLFELQLVRDYLPEAGSLVDVGGGLGVNLLCLRRLGYCGPLLLIDRFVEYDQANRMGPHEKGRTLMAQSGIQILETEFWPVLGIPLENDSCDVVTSFDVVEHLPGNPIQHLSEIRRALKPNGRLLLGAPNASSFMKRVDLAIRGRHPYAHFDDWMRTPYYEHYREYTPREYREMVRRSGFRFTDQIMSSAVPRSRARSHYHNGRHSWFSPVSYALYGIAAVEGLVTKLRHTVYSIAVKPAE